MGRGPVRRRQTVPVSEHFAEIRFAKKQQWYVTTAALTLIAAIFALADKIHPTLCEKGVVVIALIAIATFASCIMCSLQKHLVRKRKEIDAEDDEKWWESRGTEIMWPLVVVIVLGAVTIIYLVIVRSQT